MQRRNKSTLQNNVSEYYFAVAPYEVYYTSPNDEIYSIYFQKGLQILGTTQYPIQNHQKLKTLKLPIQHNLIQFRLFSDRNAQYHWSIYKRIDEMQEFLESNPINLKQFFNKQTQKKIQSRLQSKSEIKSQTKIDLQSKNGAYSVNINMQTARLILKFYIFKATSFAQLTKLVQEKTSSKGGDRTTLSEISSNKVKSRNSIKKQQLSINNSTQQAPKQIPQSNITPNIQSKYYLSNAQANQSGMKTLNPSLGQIKVAQNQTVTEQKGVQTPAGQAQPIVEGGSQKVLQKSPSVLKKQSVFGSKRQSVFNKSPSKKQQPFTSSLKQNLFNQTQTQQPTQNQQEQILVIQQTPNNNQQTPQTLLYAQTPVYQVSQQQQRLADENVQIVVPAQASRDNRKIGIILFIILIIYLMSFFNLKDILPARQQTKVQGVKKSKFGNRKKFGKV